MKDTILTILLIVGLFLVLPVCILLLRDKIFGSSRRRTAEQVQAESQAYRKRLLHPRQAEVEAEVGLLPERLIKMYSDRQLILSEKLEICLPGKDPRKSRERIDIFLPLDLEGQEYTCDLELLAKAKGFCFAGDGCGNFYWVPVSDTRQPDAPVFFACHDPWGNTKVADNLEDFLSWPRTAEIEEK
jgi:hypothetical protein